MRALSVNVEQRMKLFLGLLKTARDLVNGHHPMIASLIGFPGYKGDLHEGVQV